MSDKIVVIYAEGKREATDFITVYVFDDYDAATYFCKDKTKAEKYWSRAVIVQEGEQIDIDDFAHNEDDEPLWTVGQKV